MVGADGLEPPTFALEEIAALAPAPAVAGRHRAKRLAEASRESTLQADSNRPVL